MTYDTYRYIFIGAAILCAVMLIVTIILFFALNIRKVFGDLTGKNAKKAIEKIREENENSGDKKHKSSTVNRQRGKITDKIDERGNTVPRKPDINTGVITTKIATQNLVPETDVLVEEPDNNTTVLNEADMNTTVLNESDMNTTVLSQPEMAGEGETAVLSENVASADIFEVEYDITYIHSDEVIV